MDTYFSFFQTIAEPYLITERNAPREIRSANQAACRLLGLSEKELQNHGWDQISQDMALSYHISELPGHPELLVIAVQTNLHLLHDALTGLAGRGLIEDRLNLAIQRHQEKSEIEYGFICLDIDRLHLINEKFGHRAGDFVLQEFAKRIGHAIRPVDTAGRLDSDELCIVLDGLESHSQIVHVANVLLQTLAKPMLWTGDLIQTTVSMGICFARKDQGEAQEVIYRARSAMTQAKAMGKNSFKISDGTLVYNSLRKNKVLKKLPVAIAQELLFLEYQPIHHIADGSLAGFETLIRWNDEELGAISPLEFIPLAEESGLMQQISAWILKQTCACISLWQNQLTLPDEFFIAVNLSGTQFLQIDLPLQIRKIITDSGVNPRFIKLEITETEAMKNASLAVMLLTQLRHIGVRLSIDDFGTGYSSLSYLQQFPVHTLKIDLSFIRNLEKNTTNQGITETIIRLSHMLSMDVIAEGVETADQLAMLGTMGCDMAQGWFYSPSLLPSDAADWIKRHSFPCNYATTIESSS